MARALRCKERQRDEVHLGQAGAWPSGFIRRVAGAEVLRSPGRASGASEYPQPRPRKVQILPSYSDRNNQRQGNAG
jgi:hypothetical protein